MTAHPPPLTDTEALAWELEQTSQALADLRYQVSHDDDRLAEATTALRLCRLAIDADHCSSCRAAASLATSILEAIDAEGAPA